MRKVLNAKTTEIVTQSSLFKQRIYIKSYSATACDRRKNDE